MTGKQFPILLIESRILDLKRIAELASLYKYTGSRKRAPLVFNETDVFFWWTKDKIRMVSAVDSTGELFGILGVCTRKKKPDQLWISFLVVDPHLQRMGIGRTLFEQAVAMAESMGLCEIVTECHSNNRDLIHFLTAMGFTARRKKKNLTFSVGTIGILAFTYPLPVSSNESN